MIELASVKIVIDLFKGLLGLIEEPKRRKKGRLEKNYEPLFKKMEEVAREYHAALSDTLRELSQSDNPDHRTIYDKLVARRDDLIMARNGVLGAADAFIEKSLELHRIPDVEQPHAPGEMVLQRVVASIYLRLPKDFDLKEEIRAQKGEHAALVYSFARSIRTYFASTPYVSSRSRSLGSIMSRVIDDLEETRTQINLTEEMHFTPPRNSHNVVESLKVDITELEKRWINVSKAFAELKNDCQN